MPRHAVWSVFVGHYLQCLWAVILLVGDCSVGPVELRSAAVSGAGLQKLCKSCGDCSSVKVVTANAEADGSSWLVF